MREISVRLANKDLIVYDDNGRRIKKGKVTLRKSVLIARRIADGSLIEITEKRSVAKEEDDGSSSTK